MKNKKQGISLIVLVITIIVIIILSGIVILNLNQSNTTDKAKEAVFKSDVANFKADLGMYHVNELGKTMADYDGKLLDGDKATLTYDDEVLQGKTMVDAIPLMNQKLQYTEKFIIFEGKLVYVGNNPKEIEWSDDLDIPSTAKSPVAIIELPNPPEVKSGTKVTYTIRFSAGNKISNFKKENIELLTEDKQSTTNNITIGEIDGTDTEKTVEIAVDTTNLEAGKYMLQVKSGTVADEVTGLTNKEVYSESFEVDNTAPGIPEILAEPTSITNGNVTITINYSEDSLTKQYKIGTGEWQDYTTSFVIEENVDIIARAINKVSTQTLGEVLAIRNIDKQAPTITLTTTATTTSSITVKATANDVGTAGLDTNSYEYSKDDGATWTTPSSNTTYTFENLTTGTYKLKARVKDKATNVGVSSTLTELTKGMDTLGNITIIPSTTAPTNQNVTVTINYPTGIAVKQYKIGTGSWQNYTGVLTITENTDILAKGMDAGGNVLEIADALAIRNIDKQAPTITLATTTTTTSSITVKATASDVGTAGLDTNSYEYSKDDGATWTTLSNNTTYTFENLTTGTYKLKARVKDKATNVGVSSTLTEVTKGMDTLGNITIMPSTTAPTNQNVTVTINYPTGIDVKQYKLGSGSWQNYTGVLTITENTDILAKGMDAGGNVLEIADALAIRNIDKQAPTISLATTATTTSSITIKATASDVGTAGINTSSYEYSKDDGVTWTTPASNTTYTFENLVTGTYKLKARVKDKATNVGVSSTLTELTKGMDTLGNITIVPSTTAPTNQNITVTINYPTGIEIKQYKIGTGSWQNYTGVLTITENTDILAKGMDAGGNVLEIADALSIRNIDKVNPNAASISATSSNGRVTGTINVSDNTGGSGIDFTNSKYVINTVSTTYGTTASIWSSATTINTSPKSISEAKTDGTYYVHVLVVDKAGNKVVSKSSSGIVVSNMTITDPGWNSSKGVNAPVLVTGMTPIKWNGSTWVDTTVNDSSWYDYKTKQWANARTADGSFWVWIPRYEYKIAKPHKDTAQSISVNFKQNLDTSATSGYIVHPGFTFGTTQLKGIWMAKFEATAREGISNSTADNVTTKNIKVIPNVSSWRNITISKMFDVCRKMETDATYGWGTSGNGIDTHLVKNVEWGAVSYLSNSIYGKNAEVWVNPSDNYITGLAGSILIGTRDTYEYNTTNGMQASATGNITGIYDMSGGAVEYSASYLNNGNSNLATNGYSLLNADSKYKDIYIVGETDTKSNNYEANSTKVGDAIYETSDSSNYYQGAWYSDYTSMPEIGSPFFTRGGWYIYGTNAGLFWFTNTTGQNSENSGFRPIITISNNI